MISGLAPGYASINSLAYNPLDNYLYASVRGPEKTFKYPEYVVRVGYDGSTQFIVNLPANPNNNRRFFVGDITPDGQYWTSSQDKTGDNTWAWVKINLAPGTANYGYLTSHTTVMISYANLSQNDCGLRQHPSSVWWRSPRLGVCARGPRQPLCPCHCH